MPILIGVALARFISAAMWSAYQLRLANLAEHPLARRVSTWERSSGSASGLLTGAHPRLGPAEERDELVFDGPVAVFMRALCRRRAALGSIRS